MKTNKHMTSSLAALTLIAVLAAGLQGCAVVAVGGAGAAVATDRRSAGAMVDDQAIELKINNALFKNDQLSKQAHINFTSYGGVVLLTGEAPSEALRDNAVELVRHVDNVRRVHNEIIIAAPSPIKSRNQDAWITTKVKTKLIATKEVSANSVKVVTENGSVYLMGLLTRAEADAVTEVARNVDGVSRVVTLFEYQD
ncbi:MAG: division/outer membrane stress-associated lipid-binding lipoprotein [Pseudomonadota bacterium]